MYIRTYQSQECAIVHAFPLRLSAIGRLGGGWEVSELSKSVSAQRLYRSYLMIGECYFFPVFGLVYRARPTSLPHQRWGRGVV